MFADGDALLELIEKGDSIGFHMRGGYVHPSAISLGVKSGGAVKRVDIDAFLASFRPKKGGDEDAEDDEDDQEDTSESEDPEGVDEDAVEVQLEETDADPEDLKPPKLKKPAAKANPEANDEPVSDDEPENEPASDDEPDVKQVVGSASDDEDNNEDEVAVTEVVGGDDSEQEPTPRRVTFDASVQRNDNISDEE